MINFKKGINLIEILVTISIIIIITAIVIPNLNSFRKQQVIQNTVEDIVSLLNKAREKTMSSYNSEVYGVHFESDRVVLFSGSSYNSNDPDNEIVILDNSVFIQTPSSFRLGSNPYGTSNVIFNRIMGSTNNDGVVVLKLVSNQSVFKTISVGKTGLVVES